MHRLRVLTISLLLAGTATLAPQTAHASAEMIIRDATGHRREMQLDFTGSAWFFGTHTYVGGAAWFGFPILDEGFVPPWNDSLVIEGGFVTTYRHYVLVGQSDVSILAVAPMAGVRWNVHLMEPLTVFATAKVGARIGIAGDTYYEGWGFDGIFSVGAYWHFSDAMYLRAELGNVLQVGVSFPLGTP